MFEISNQKTLHLKTMMRVNKNAGDGTTTF